MTEHGQSALDTDTADSRPRPGVLVVNRVFDLFTVPRGGDDANVVSSLIQHIVLVACS